MSLNQDRSPSRRRRGKALEDALLEAAWDELVAQDYDDLTIEAVAARAETARAVIYRRWPNKPELVRAAIAHHAFQDSVEAPDTGSLRSDLLALLRGTNERRAPLVAILATARVGVLFDGTVGTLADLRDELLAGRDTLIDQVFERAVARGETDPALLTPRVRAVAFDLFRHEILMTHRPLPGEVIESIVDEIVLPLTRPR